MDVALEHRQAEQVRADPTDQHVVAVVEQVVRGDGGADIAAGGLDELHGIAGGDVFEHYPQGRKACGYPAQLLVDEVLLTIENIDLAPGDFAVDQQWQADFGHGFQHTEDIVDSGHAGCRVGGRSGRIELGSMDEAAGLGPADVVRTGSVGEVQHHQWLEITACRAGRKDALAIAFRLVGIAYRGHQIRHDDGAGELASSIRDGVRQDGAIAQVNVPVVGAQQGKSVGHAGFPGG